MVTLLMDDPLEENMQIQREILLLYPCQSMERGLNDLKEQYEASMLLDL